MKILHIVVIFLTIISSAYSWSWNSKNDDSSTIKQSKIQKRSDTPDENNLKTTTESNQTIEETQGRNFYSDKEIYSNETSVDEIVETLIHGRRQGRILDGNYDQVYADPDVQEALAKGDDVEARNLIKDKLCTLGLMSCDESGDNPEGKRPFYSNIYAQGPPQPPNRRPIGPPYGAPRPMPPPSKYHGPPRKVGYVGGRPSGPSYHGPYLDSPPPSAQDNSLSYGKPPPGAIIYGSKPPGPVYTGNDAPYNFEHVVGDKIHVGDHSHHQSSSFGSHSSSFGSNSFSGNSGQIAGDRGTFGSYGPSSNGIHLGKPSVIVSPQAELAHSALNPVAAASTLQQHVHHHFHHVDDAAAAKPAVVTVPVPVPVPTGNGINSQFAAQSAGGFAPISSAFTGSNPGGFDFQKQSAAFNAGFNGASQGGLLTGTGFTGVNSGYKPPGSLYTSGAGIKPVAESGLGNYAGSSFGQSVSGSYSGSPSSFHSTNPDYYKKELQSGSQYNGLNNYAQQNKYTSGGYNGQNQYQSSNQGEDYQGFETARQQNVDCVCVPINQCPAADRIGRKDDLILPIDPRNLGTDIEAANDETNNSTLSKSSSDDSNQESKKVKRETKAASKQSDDIDDEDPLLDTQARLLVGSNFGNNFGNNLPQTTFGLTKRKILPTYGVSFGLPFTAGAYPFNAFGGGFPAANPYFGSIGPNGLSLGLINVNPLVSLQVTKNEFGEKLVKPLVNLHVTPSEHILHKVGSLFKAKTQEILLNANHQHYHSHTHVPPPPELLHPVHPNFHNGPPHFHNSPPHFHGPPPPIYHGPPVVPLPDQHFHHGQEFLPNIPQLGFGGVQPHFHSKPNYLSYPPNPIENGGFNQFDDFDPYRRSYNISNRQIRFKDENIGRGYADSFDYKPVPGEDRLGRILNIHAENNNEILAEQDEYFVYNNGGKRINFPDDSGQNRFGKQINFPIDENNSFVQNELYPIYTGAGKIHRYRYGKQIQFPIEEDNNYIQSIPTPIPGKNEGGDLRFPNDRRRKRSINDFDYGDKKNEESSGNNKNEKVKSIEKRQSYFGGRPSGGFKQCNAYEVCCRTPYRPAQKQIQQQLGRCGTRNAHGITGRIKNPVYIDGDSEYGEYPWQAAILKKDPKESVYVCGGTIIDHQHIITAAHCVKTYQGFDLRVRLGEWDVNHDVEFYPYVERDVISVSVHPEYYAGTLDNDLAILKLDQPIDFIQNPHISPACLPDKYSDFTGARCWTTGWGKDAFGDYGKYQNILKEVDVPVIEHQQCQSQLRRTRLGYNYKLNPGFICAGGEEGKDACKGDGGGPMVCERNGFWQLVGVVSWGIGCGQVNVPGVYVRVSYYLDWISQITRY